MKKLALILSILFLSAMVFAQDIVVSFIGVNANGGYQRLDSVAIHNYSQGWDRTAVYPDTVMVAILNGIGNVAGDAEMLSCAPNPFDGETDFVVNLPQDGAVSIRVFDVSGRMFAEYNGIAMTGANVFGVSLLQPDVYFLSVTSNCITSTIKLMNAGNGGSDRIWSKGTMASEKIFVSGDFNINDVMRYAGYATYNGEVYESASVTQPQYRSETISLEFDIVNPCSSPSFAEISIERCASYEFGGETYTQSGDYVHTFRDANGCDSIVLLHLNITGNGTPIFTEVEINTCADPFVYNGETFTESGGYQQVLTSADGCDSIVLLWLHLGSGVYDERDGNSYCSIMIGEQEWFSENVRYLPSVNNLSNASVADARYYVYDYDGTDVDEARNNPNYSEYGVLYNWKAAQTACPAGWHLPSDAEWSQLEVYLENNGYNFDDYIDTDNDRATHNVIAKSLSSTSGWGDCSIRNTPGWEQSKNNTSSFNGKPAGMKIATSQFQEKGARTWWWTSDTEYGDSNSGWDRRLKYDLEELSKTHNHKSVGVSVRCVRN
ncbi:MAG: T9SS type A sorting domain-containing protein [Bacteroidales bacterium]|nr:T9SS type A sorting domain-containing protein [Bacteroidales bacterium]